MTVKINLHKTHREFTDGREIVEVAGNTVGACIEDLVKRYPGLKAKLFDKKGILRNFIEIYLNMESAYPDELAKPVSDGDEIYLTLALAGG